MKNMAITSSNSGYLIEERFNPRLIPTLYKNFKDPIQAILELVDNAVDDRTEGKPMIITIDLEKDHMTIVNKGGTGMGIEELDGFFAWGQSEKKGKLGRYGQGGKAAMGYLGKSWQIRATKKEQDVEYVIREDDWDDRTGGLKKYIPSTKKASIVNEGVVQIDIWRLKRTINKKEVKRILGSFYRPLIKFGMVEIYSGGKVLPEEFPLEMPEEYFELELNDGNKVTGWLSFLETGSRVKGGVRCYAFNRLIVDREFFGQKDPGFKESLDRLVGELYIDIEGLPLLMNKSDFDRGSPIWEEIRKKIYKKMEPYIQLLLEEKDKDLPTEKEQRTAKYAGEVWAQFLRYWQHEQREGTMPGLPISHGQKPPGPREMQTQENDQAEQQPTRGQYKPATPPPLEHLGKRRRTGAFPEPKIHSLPEYVRYQLSEENGTKVMKINNRFPSYKLRKNQLSLYIWETLAVEYAKAEDPTTQTVDDYIDEMNELLHRFGIFIRKKGVKLAG